MSLRRRWELTIVIVGLILVAVAWQFLLRPPSPSIAVDTGPDAWTCAATYIAFRNTGLTPAAVGGWTIALRDGSFTYVFPDRWLMPGAELHVWPGRGIDDMSNLYAGQTDDVWRIGEFHIDGPPTFIAFSCHP